MGNYINRQKTPVSSKLVESTFEVSEYSLKGLYTQGKVVYVYDGDTVHIVLSINKQLVKYNCRLLGIDSPEICPKNSKDQKAKNMEITSAVKSRNFLINKLTGQVTIEGISKREIKDLCGQSRKLTWVKCHDFDKYGRLLVELFENQTDSLSINQIMVKQSYAVEYDGGTKKDFSPSNFNF